MVGVNFEPKCAQGKASRHVYGWGRYQCTSSDESALDRKFGSSRNEQDGLIGRRPQLLLRFLDS